MGKLAKAQKKEIKLKSIQKKSRNEGDVPTMKTKGKNKIVKTHVLKLAKQTTGGIRKKILSKKEKQRQKSLKLMQELNKTLEAFKEDEQKKIREKRPIIGDLKPLLDSLPSLDELVSIRGSSNKTGITEIDRRIPKKDKSSRINTKTEAMLDRFDVVQKIWRNPEFQKDPRKLISEQIRQRRLASIEMK